MNKYVIFAILNGLICILDMLKMLCEHPETLNDKDLRKAAGAHIDSTIKYIKEVKGEK